jgi:uncharacterized membrane protein
MVIDPQDVISSHALPEAVKGSFSLWRWMRHFLYMPWRTRHYFNQAARQQIQQAVGKAEQGHAGEIQVIIEGHLPLNMAASVSTKTRAQQLFAAYGVWDTAGNSGVLLYINLCERRVEIVADRGINQFVTEDYWQQLCGKVTHLLAAEQYVQAIAYAVQEMGTTLQRFYAMQAKDDANELADAAIFL